MTNASGGSNNLDTRMLAFYDVPVITWGAGMALTMKPSYIGAGIR